MIRKIDKEELVRMCRASEKFVLVDVLERDSYEKEHIPGALSIPLAELGRRVLGILNKEATIVVYCASFDCKASTMAAEKLLSMGYENVLDYKGGLKDYREAGFILEGSLHGGRSSCASYCACD